MTHQPLYYGLKKELCMLLHPAPDVTIKDMDDAMKEILAEYGYLFRDIELINAVR